MKNFTIALSDVFKVFDRKSFLGFRSILSIVLFFSLLFSGVKIYAANTSITLVNGEKIKIIFEQKVLSKSEADYYRNNAVPVPLKVYFAFPETWESKYFTDMQVYNGEFDYKIISGEAGIMATVDGVPGVECNGGFKGDGMAISWIEDRNAKNCPQTAHHVVFSYQMPFKGGLVPVSVGNVVEFGTLYFILPKTSKGFQVQAGIYPADANEGSLNRIILNLKKKSSEIYLDASSGKQDWGGEKSNTANFEFIPGGITILGAPEVTLNRENLIPACPNGELSAVAQIQTIASAISNAKQIKWQYAAASAPDTWVDITPNTDITIKNPASIAIGALGTSTLNIGKISYPIWNTRLLRCVAEDDDKNIGYMDAKPIKVHDIEKFTIALDTANTDRPVLTTSGFEGSLGHNVREFILPALKTVNMQPVKIGTTNIFGTDIYPFGVGAGTGPVFENVKRIQGSPTEEVNPSRFVNQTLTVTGRPTYHYIRAYVTAQNCLVSSDTILVKAKFEANAPTMTGAAGCFTGNNYTFTANSNLVGAIPIAWTWIIRTDEVTGDPMTTTPGGSPLYVAKLKNGDDGLYVITPDLNTPSIASTIITNTFNLNTGGLLPSEGILGTVRPTTANKRWATKFLYAQYTYRDGGGNIVASPWGRMSIVATGTATGESPDILSFTTNGTDPLSERSITINQGEIVKMKRFDNGTVPIVGNAATSRIFTWEKEDPIGSGTWYYEKKNPDGVAVELTVTPSITSNYRIRFSAAACDTLSQPLLIRVRSAAAAGYISATMDGVSFASEDKACSGQNLSFTLNNYVTGAGSEVRWYYKIGENQTEYPISGFASDAIAASNSFTPGSDPATSVFNVFAEVQSVDGIKATTEAFTVKVVSNEVAPSVTVDPASLKACEGANVTLSANFTPGSNTALPASYQWQASMDGKTWNAAPGQSPGAPYKFSLGAGSPLQYRAVAVNMPCPLKASTPVTLIRNPLPVLGSITSSPDPTIKKGSVEIIYTDGYSSGYTYAWTKQQTVAGSGAVDASFVPPVNITKGSATEKKMTINPFQDATVSYKMAVTSTEGCEASLVKEFIPTEAAQPTLTTNKTAAVCPLTADVQLTVAGAVVGTTLYWQYSTDGTTFKDIANNTNTTYTVPSAILVNTGTTPTYTFRAGLSSASGPFSTTATLAVNTGTKTVITLPATATFCQNADTSLTAITSTASNFTWEAWNGSAWVSASGTVTGASNSISCKLTISNTPSGSITKYRVNATPTSGTCPTADTKEISISYTAQPLAATISGNSSVCANTPISLTASVASAQAYVWTGATPALTGGQTATFTPTTAGTQNISVQYKMNGCWSPVSVVKPVLVNAQPTLGPITLTDASNSLCAGVEKTFQVTSTGGSGAGTTYTYQWSLDNVVLTGLNTQTIGPGLSQRTYTNSTVKNGYVMSAKVTDGNGCWDTTTAAKNTVKVFDVNASAKVVWTKNLSSGTICQGGSNTFEVRTNVNADFTWYESTDNGSNWNPKTATSGATNATTSTLVISNLNVSGYKYKVVATPVGGGCAAPNTSDVAILNMIATPVTPVILSAPNVCQGIAVDLSVIPVVGATKYEWTRGATKIVIAGTTSTCNGYAPSTAGAEDIYVRYQIAAGCWSDYAKATRTVNPKIVVAPITSLFSTLCSGSPITFDCNATAGSGSTIASYQWSSSAKGIIGTTKSPTYTPDANTTAALRHEDISVLITDNKGCTASSLSTVTPIAAKTINIIPKPTVNALTVVGTSACDGTAPTTAFTINPAPSLANGAISSPLTLSYTYQWKKEGSVIPTATGTTYNPGTVSMSDNAKKFTVDVMGTIAYNSVNCPSTIVTSSQAPLVVNPLPVAGTLTAGAICSGTTATLTSSGASSSSTPLNYTFKIGATAGAVPSVVVGAANQAALSATTAVQATTGTFNISVDVKDAKACVKQATGTLVVNPTPVIATIGVKNVGTGNTVLPANIKQNINYEFSSQRSSGLLSGNYTYNWTHSTTAFPPFTDAVLYSAASKKQFTPTTTTPQLISVYAVDENNCQSAPQNVNFTPSTPSAITLSPLSPLTMCLNASGQATDTLTTTASQACTYEWSVSTDGGSTWTAVSGAISSNGNTISTLSITNPLANAYKYKVSATPTVEGYSGANSTTDVKVYAQPKAPVITAKVGSTSQTEICQNTAVDFSTDITSYDAAGFRWAADKAPTSIGSTTNAVSAYIPSASGDYTITASYLQNTCRSAQANFTLTVNPAISTGSITFNPGGPVCPATLVDVTAAPVGGTGPFSYAWTVNGSANAVTANTFKHTASTNTTSANIKDAFLFTVTDTKGCTFTTSPAANLVVKPTPVLSVSLAASPNVAEICEGTDISYTATATGGDSYTYAWTKNGTTLSDGGVYSGTATSVLKLTAAGLAETAMYAVSVNGSKSVCPAATAATASKALTVNPMPSVNAPTATTVCEGLGSDFVATATGGTAPLKYEFFIDGVSKGAAASANTKNVILSNADNGKPLTVKVTDAKTCSKTSLPTTLTVNAKPVITITSATTAEACAHTDFSFTATASSTQGLTPIIKWYDVASREISNNAVLSISDISTTATYTAKANVTNITTGCMATEAVSNLLVTVNAAPNFTFNPDLAPTLEVCEATPTTELIVGATPESGHTYSYEWYKNNVKIATTTAKHTISDITTGDAATYYVMLTKTKTGASQCGSTTKKSTEMVLTVNALPTVEMPLASVDPVCAGLSTVFTAPTPGTPSGAAITSYAWYRNGTLIPDGEISGKTTATPTYTPAASDVNAQQAISFKVTDANACTSPASDEYTIGISGAAKGGITELLDVGYSANPITSTTICKNAPDLPNDLPLLTVSGQQGGTVRWQKSSTSATTGFTDIPSSANVQNFRITAASITMPTGSETQKLNYYRAVIVNDPCTQEVYSAAFTLKVDNLSAAGTITRTSPAGNPTLLVESLCTSETRGYTLGNYVGTINEWQKSSDSITWTPISGTANAAYSPTVIQGTQNFRVKLTNGICPPAYTSKNVKLTGIAQPALGSILAKLTDNSTAVTAQGVCVGTNVVLSLTNPSNSTIQWQSKPSSGGTFTDISGQTAFSTTQSPAVSTIYQAVVKTSTCAAQTTAPFTVNVTPQPSITTITPASPYMMCSATANTSWNLSGSAGSSATWQRSTSADLSLATATTTALSYASLAPKVNTDTSYYYQATYAPSISGVLGCTPVKSAILKVKVGATPVVPVIAKVGAGNQCAWDDLNIKISNFANKRGTLRWYHKKPGDANFMYAGTAFDNMQTYTLTADLEEGNYVFKVMDSIGVSEGANTCGSAAWSSELTVTVKTPAMVTKITSTPDNGWVCAGTTAKMDVVAIGASMYQWQSTTNTSTGTISNVGTNHPSYTANAPVSEMYYRVYATSDAACKADTSDWVKIATVVTPSATITAPVSSNPICQGTELKLNVKYSNADEAVIYTGASSGSINTIFKTLPLSLSSTENSFEEILPTANAGDVYYKIVFKNTSVPTACNTYETPIKFQRIDELSKRGTFTAEGATNPGYTNRLSEMAGQSIKLNLTDANGTYTIQYVKAVNGETNPPMNNFVTLGNADQTFNPSDFPKSTTLPVGDSIWYRVSITNGACPTVISDTVYVKIEPANKIVLQAKKTNGGETVSGNLCEGTSIDVTVSSVPGGITTTYKEWQTSKDAGAWVSSPIAGDPTSHIGLSHNLVGDAGTYKVRLMFFDGTKNDYSSEFTVTFDAPATKGSISADKTDLCMGGGSATIRLENYTNGNISRWQRAEDEAFSKGVKELTGTGASYIVTTNSMEDSAWFRAEIANKACGTVASDPILINIHKASAPGAISSNTPIPVCYDNATTLTLANNVGTVVRWEVSTDAESGPFTEIAASANKQFISENSKQQKWFRAVVQNTAVCGEVTSSAFRVSLFDTLGIAKQPMNAEGSSERPAELKLMVESRDIMGGSDDIRAVSYDWQFAYKTDLTAWTSIVSSTDPDKPSFSSGDAFSSTLKVPYAYFYGNNGNDTTKRYRCVITVTTPACGQDKEITNIVSIKEVPASKPGLIATLMGDGADNCYYADSMATYYIQDYVGADMKFIWTIVNNGVSMGLDDPAFAHLDIRQSPKHDTLYMKTSASMNGYKLNVEVTDAGLNPPSTWTIERTLCSRSVPTFTLTSLPAEGIICATTSKTYTVHPLPSDREYAYAWYVKKKGEVDYTSVVGTSAEYEENKQHFTIKSANAALDSASIKVEIRENSSYVGVVGTFAELLRVEQPVTAIAIAGGDTLCEGANTVLLSTNSLSLTPVTYVWERYANGAWIEKQAPAEGADELSFTSLTKADSALYRVSAKNKCNIGLIASAPVTLAVKALPKVKTEPSALNPVLCNGGSTTITVFTEGDDVSYQWRHNGFDIAAGANVSGETTSVLSLTSLRLSQSGAYSVKLTGNRVCDALVNADPIISKGAVVRVDTVPLFTKLTKLTGVVSKSVTFTVEVSNDTVETLSYEWYIKRASVDADFVKVADLVAGTPAYTDTFANYTTKSFNIKNLPLAYNGSLVRCALTNDCGTSTTNDALLEVLNKLGISEQADDAVVCEGLDTAFIIEVNLDPDDIEWQMRSNTTANWIKIDDNSSFEAVYNNDGKVILKLYRVNMNQTGFEFRCLMNQNGPAEDRVTSNIYTLSVNKPAELVDNTISSTRDIIVLGANEPENAQLTGPALAWGTPLPEYVWQRKQLGKDADFVDGLKDVNSINFSPTDTGTYAHRYIASNNCGSDTARVSISVIRKLFTEKMLLTTTTPQGVSKDTLVGKKQGESFAFEVCESNTLSLFSPVSNTQAVATSSTWQYSDPADPMVWKNVSPSGAISIANDTLRIQPVNVMYSGFRFRHIKTAALAIASDTSAVIKIVVSADVSLAPSLKDFAEMVLVGENVELKADLGVNIENKEKGSYTYHWYEISKAGVSTQLGSSEVPTFSLSAMPLSKDSARYFFEVENLCSTKAKSDTLRLRVVEKAELVWDSVRSSIVIEGGTTASINICENTTALMVVELKKGVSTDIVWEKSSPAGVWTVIEASENYAFSATKDTMFVTAVREMDALMYRVIAVSVLPALNDTTNQNLLLNTLVKPTLNEIVRVPEYDSLCIGQSVRFSTSTLDADALYWEIRAEGKAPQKVGDLNSNSFEIPSIHDSLKGAKVYAIATNACGSAEVFTELKLREPRPIHVSLTGDTSVCMGVPANYSLHSTDMGSAPVYRWYIGEASDAGLLHDYTTSTLENYSFSNPGAYIVIAELESDVYCSSNAKVRDTLAVTVYARPSVTASIQDEVLVTGQSTVVKAKASEGSTPYSFAWTPADKLVDAQKDSTATVVFTEAGEFMFIVRVTDANVCMDEDTVYLRVNPNFTLDGIEGHGHFTDVNGAQDTNMVYTLDPDNLALIVCENQYITMQPKTSGGKHPISYNFSVDPVFPEDYRSDYIGDSVFTFFMEKGLDSIVMYMRDADGNELRAYIYIVMHSAPEVSMDLTPKMKDDIYYEVQPIIYTAEPQHFSSYQFYKLMGGSIEDRSKDTSQPFYMTSFKKHEENEVLLIVKDEKGCRGSATASVTIRPLPNVLIPDDPTAPENGIIFPGCDIEVFNSWGLIIQKMGSKKGWDGKASNGKQLVNGTYYYNVKLPTEDGKTTIVRGAVTIIENKK